MKIVKIGEPKVIMSNPGSKHNYFAWPTAARLQNGKIAVAASGYRRRHVCPFGKTVISYSEDNGETYTLPAPVIDTVLDDRDGGIVPFGKSNVIVTSFNNAVAFQKTYAQTTTYDFAYLETVTPEEEKEAIGSTFRISNDCGVTFGELKKSPITSPHGPVELPDGTLLWVGRTYQPNPAKTKGADYIQAHKINPDGTMEFVGQIDEIKMGNNHLFPCEPHAIVLNDGSILAHIRVNQYSRVDGYILTIFQSISHDGGKTWSKPVQLLSDLGGAPPHLFRHSSGMLICTYGYRQEPFGVRVMFSKDEGKTWDIDNDLYVNNVSEDLGYPSTVELEDGSMITIFYAHQSEEEPAVIMEQKWRFEDDEI